MSKRRGKKYDTDVKLDQATGAWAADVIRRRTSRGNVVMYKSSGFETQQLALEWAQAKLAEFLRNRKARSERRRERRAVRRQEAREREHALEKMSLRELVQHAETERDCKELFRWKAETLWEEVAFRHLKAGASESEAIKTANERVGANYTARRKKALTGELDTVLFLATQIAYANAQRLAEIGQSVMERMRRDPEDSAPSDE